MPRRRPRTVCGVDRRPGSCATTDGEPLHFVHADPGRQRPEGGRRGSSRTRRSHDPLTGLPNRALLHRPPRAGARPRRAARRAGRGRVPRRRPLQGRQRQPRARRRRRAARQQVGARLPHGGARRATRSARFGGDEFVDPAATDVDATQRRRCSSPSGCVAALARPFSLDGADDCCVTASLGIALVRAHERRRRRCSATPTRPCTGPRARAARASELFDSGDARRGASTALAHRARRCAAALTARRATPALPADRRPRDRRDRRPSRRSCAGQHPERRPACRRATSSPMAEETRPDRRRSASGCCARPAAAAALARRARRRARRCRCAVNVSPAQLEPPDLVRGVAPTRSPTPGSTAADLVPRDHRDRPACSDADERPAALLPALKATRRADRARRLRDRLLVAELSQALPDRRAQDRPRVRRAARRRRRGRP